MAALSKPLSSSSTVAHLRPFDVRRDLEPVADLVELCFADTLDGEGRDYLARMRTSARQPAFVHLASATADWASLPFSGFVWQEDGRLVGNASIIPYYVKGRRYFLIANVAVHPEYRRRGIGRNLTRQAIEYVRKRGAPEVWLHVREENFGAVSLYENLGFVERARRTTWYSDPALSIAEPLKSQKVITPHRSHWELARAWLLRDYPPLLSWHMAFNLRTLQPGFVGEFYRFLYNAYIEQWAIPDGDRISAAVFWQSMAAHANALWLAAPPKADEEIILALLSHARRHAPSQRPLILDYPAHTFSQAIHSAGFYDHQTLIWMVKPLSSPPV